MTDTPSAPTPPRADKIPHTLTHHGTSREDEYYWLRDDKRENPRIIEYLDEENAYAEQVMADTASLQEELFEEMKGRLVPDDASVPYRQRDYWYYTRYEEGLEYPLYSRKQGSLEGAEQIMIDGNARAKGHDYYNLGDLDVSENQQLIAFSEDTVSRRIYTIHVKDLRTGELLSDEIKGTSGQIAWASDDETLFYVKREPETLRAYQVWRHTMGQPVEQDALVYEEPDDAYSVSITRARSRQYMVLHSGSTLSDEVRLIDASQPTSAPMIVYPRERAHEYSVMPTKGHLLYILTNWNATNFRLMATTIEDRLDRTKWVEIVPHRQDVFLDDATAFRDHLVLSERVDGMTELRVEPRDPKTGRLKGSGHAIAFDDAAYYTYVSTTPEFDTHTLRFGYTSMTTPNSTYDYDMNSERRTLLKQDRVLGGFDASNYKAERVMIEAQDGTRIPVSIVYRRDLDRAKPAPLYQYGYGSYGHSMEPYFSAARISLLDRGFIYAMVHIRGGQEFGRRWYEDGKLLKKMNTFTDFIDASRALIDQGYTAPDKLVISGGSAGGLLVGAVANMAPDLYGAVVADVPFVDVVTTMLDETIPLTTFEYDEWGNPNESQYYTYMLSYSPYDNVRAQAYPPMLVLTGLHDSQVQYWEPAKWVARLRDRKTDDNILLLHTNMETGHGGASGRYQRYHELALEYAFILKALGMTKEATKE